MPLNIDYRPTVPSAHLHPKIHRVPRPPSHYYMQGWSWRAALSWVTLKDAFNYERYLLHYLQLVVLKFPVEGISKNPSFLASFLLEYHKSRQTPIAFHFTLCFQFVTFLLVENVEVIDGKVTVCRDAVKGKCTRPNCKYYHPTTSSSSSASAPDQTPR